MRFDKSINALLVAIGAFAPGVPAAASSDIVLVSRGTSGEKANAAAHSNAISRTGRYVAFVSRATNLVPEDTDSTADIFLRDTRKNTTTLVSRAPGAGGPKGDGNSSSPELSSDGRFVAFTSSADNLAPGSASEEAQVFIRDTWLSTTTLVSRASGATGQVANHTSSGGAMSADGRFVAFRSNASNLDPDDPEVGLDVFVRDLAAQTTSLVSRARGVVGEAGNDDSLSQFVAADGSRVGFTSYATNLHPVQNNGVAAVFVRDLAKAKTTLVSKAFGDDGERADDDSFLGGVSADGSHVVFGSLATNLIRARTKPYNDIFLRDLDTRKTQVLTRNLPIAAKLRPSGAGGSSISANGKLAVFTYGFRTKKRRAPTRDRAFLADLRSNDVERIRGIVGADEKLQGYVATNISANGRWLAVTAVSRLHPADHDNSADVFAVKLPK